MLCTKLVLLMCIVYFVSESKAMKPGDKGVCVIKKSLLENVEITYKRRALKHCKSSRCYIMKTRTEPRTRWQTHTVCCNGWQYDSESDGCVPVCSTGCVGGQCIAPEVCQCNPPLHLEPVRRNSCIPSECDPPCSGAQCWNNSCQCLPHHQRYNATHCAQCDEGYTINSDLKCIPKCDSQCVNSSCVAPNTCKCLEGYRRKDKYACEPVCDCVNAVCSRPGYCTCMPGYSAVNATFCAPSCENCDAEECNETCVCRDGFTKVAGVCKPVCNKACVNGVCSAPNVCECNEGYVKNASDPAVCFKSCAAHCEGYCDSNGVCHENMCTYNETIIACFGEGKHHEETWIPINYL